METLYESFVNIVGEYTPISGVDANGVPVEYVDWGYIGVVILMGVVLYGILRVIGGLLNSK